MSTQYLTNTPYTYYELEDKQKLRFLDHVLTLFQSGSINQGMIELRDQLYELYSSTTTEEWEALLNNELLNHPVKDFLMQDPLTARSFLRPRNYAGDAVLLDMIYFPERMQLANSTPAGKKLYHYTSQSRIARALRERKSIVADYIDRTAFTKSNSRILSVACGHCREIELSKAASKRSFSEFIGVDQDPRSLEMAANSYPELDLNLLPVSIADILKGKLAIGKFDLIYSAGLYDYLSGKLAQRLTAKLYQMLAPGGKLILFNVISNYQEIGYFESFLNWPLIGRDRRQMLDFVSELPSNELATYNLGQGEEKTFHFLEVTKNN